MGIASGKDFEIRFRMTDEQEKLINAAFLSGPRCCSCLKKMRKGESKKLVWATPHTKFSSLSGYMSVHFACPDCHGKISKTILRARKK